MTSGAVKQKRDIAGGVTTMLGGATHLIPLPAADRVATLGLRLQITTVIRYITYVIISPHCIFGVIHARCD